MRDANLVQDATSPSGGAWPEEANVGEPWVDKFGRVRQPAAMHVAGDGTRTYGHEALATLTRTARPRATSRAGMGARAPRARNRERRPAQSRRASSSSSTSGNDPGDPDQPAPGWRWAQPSGWRGFLADRVAHIEAIA